MSVKDRAQPEGIREVPHARGVLRGGVQHIRGKKSFGLKLFLRAMRGLPTEKGENFPLLNSFFAKVQLLRFFFMGIP